MALLDARQHVTNPEGRFKVPKGNIIGKAGHHSVSGGTFFMAGQTTQQDEINHIRMIDQYHVSVDFGGFAYHTCAFPSGRSYQTGDFDGARAHVWGRNHELLGWVLIGNYESQLPSAGGLSAAAECERAFDAYLGRQVPLKGHTDWALSGHGTACPGRVRERLTTIRNLAKMEDDMALNRDSDWSEFVQMMQRFVEEVAIQARYPINSPNGERGEPSGPLMHSIAEYFGSGRDHDLDAAKHEGGSHKHSLKATITGETETS